jgi:uncharacterized membrane protein
MLREKLLHHHTEKGFRWRGGEIARIEGLSDAVFAFAVTLLVVSLEVPKTFSELAIIMRGFVPFAVCFFLLMKIWHEQYIFFRRYNLQDTLTIVLNLILLFMVLFYVYPLKFLFTVLVNNWTGISNQVKLPNGEMEDAIGAGQMSALMITFSAGYLALAGIFLAMFYRALRKWRELDLNPLEVFDTRVSIGAMMLQAAAALISLLMALFGGERLAGPSGIIYPVILSPGFTIFHSMMGRKKRKLEASLAHVEASAH